MVDQKQGKRWSLPLELFILSLVLLLISSCGGGSESTGGSSPGNSNPCLSSSTSAECVNQSNLRMDVGSAPKMHVGDSQEIKVSLYSVNSNPISLVSVQRVSGFILVLAGVVTIWDFLEKKKLLPKKSAKTEK